MDSPLNRGNYGKVAEMVLNRFGRLLYSMFPVQKVLLLPCRN